MSPLVNRISAVVANTQRDQFHQLST
ncbi:unnamed protein product, partial [Allacma fusca]